MAGLKQRALPWLVVVEFFAVWELACLVLKVDHFFSSLKIAITLAFIGSVVAETVAAERGIGYLMITASSRFDVALVFAGLLVIAIMGVVMYEIFAVIERRVTFWAVRSTEGAI